MGERRQFDRRAKQQDVLMTDGEVAKLAGVPASTVRYWRHMGTLPYVKVGKHTRVWLSEFQRIFQKPTQIESLEKGNNPLIYFPLRTLGGQHG